MHPISYIFQIFGIENKHFLENVTLLYSKLCNEVGPIVLETSLKNTGANIFNISMVPRDYAIGGINVEKNKEIILEFIRRYISNDIYSVIDSFCANYFGNIGIGIQKLDKDDYYQYNIYTTQPLNIDQVSEFYLLFPDFGGLVFDTISNHNMCGICFNQSGLVSLKNYALGGGVDQLNIIDTDLSKYKILFNIFGKFTSDFIFMKRYQISGEISEKCYLNFTNKHLYYLTKDLFLDLCRHLNFEKLPLFYLLGKEITYSASIGDNNLELYFKLN